jgi:hypothetical protein
LVFWDTGSQVTLVTQKAAHTLGLTAIPSSPLRLEGIGEGHRPRAATRFKVPLVDTGGRTIIVTAYGVDVIMSPLAEGDIVLMRETFPEVPAGGLVSASGEVSLLMGQDNLSLFPAERRRVGNAALYMSRFGTSWIAADRQKTQTFRQEGKQLEVLAAARQQEDRLQATGYWKTGCWKTGYRRHAAGRQATGRQATGRQATGRQRAVSWQAGRR